MEVVKKAILWKYYQRRGGDYTVKIRVTDSVKVVYIHTGFTSKIEHWDEYAGLPTREHPHWKEINRRVGDLMDDINFEVRLANRNGEFLKLEELKNRVETLQYGSQGFRSQMKIFAFYDIIINELEEEGRIGTADLVASNKSILSKLFLGQDKPFSAFNEWDFKKIETRVNALKSESSKSVYLRTFYRIWNIAIERKYCPERLHPKNTIRLKPYKRIKTKKRAIAVEFITDIEKLEFPYESREFRSQQYFIFCYYARGINFKDFALLRHKENVTNEFIRYVRSKNKRLYEFKLHPKAQSVVEVFKNYPIQSDAGYVFPILDHMQDTPRKVNERIKIMLAEFNEDLFAFEAAVNCPKHITSYSIRHSFATSLRNKKVDISIIKEAMGHETELQTVTYLEEINDDIVSQEVERALS